MKHIKMKNTTPNLLFFSIDLAMNVSFRKELPEFHPCRYPLHVTAIDLETLGTSRRVYSDPINFKLKQ